MNLDQHMPRPSRATWSAFEKFKLPAAEPPAPPTWPDLIQWTELASSAATQAEAELRRLLEYWDDKLRVFGGDPSRRDWTRFRPLRLSREEDWSDWLAHLLETSISGTFARHLFGQQLRHLVTDFSTPIVDREQWTSSRTQRGDLLITWRGDAVSHVEVKVGDRNFDKTFSTSRGLRSTRGNPRVWVDHVLITDDALMDWHECLKRNPNEDKVDVLLWRQVAEALRRGLLAHENMAWRAWAWTFTGAVERQLMALECPLDDCSALAPLTRLGTILSQTELLRRGKPT